MNPNGALLPECIRPLGGLSLWEASIEIRRKLGGPWGLVLFADTSDVGAGIMDFNFAELHLSIGAGLRYASPIGPVRVDLGWRVPGMQKLDGPGPLPDVSEVAPYNEQGPLDSFALSILIGEAF
jgi:outer membrane protein insertion porin family/translocation and assembly module TamA